MVVAVNELGILTGLVEMQHQGETETRWQK